MLNWLFEILAPSTFVKGINKYTIKDYQAAMVLLQRAAKWQPELQKDGLFGAYLFLVDYHLKGEAKTEDVNAIFNKLKKSSYKNHNSYLMAEAELTALLKALG